MRREAINHLKHWINKNNRKPLVVRGARQVGKTELVRIFCKEEGLDLVEVNLEEKRVTEFDSDGSFDLDRAINEILALAQKN